MSETDTSRTSTTSATRSTIRRRRKTSIFYVDPKSGWRYFREPRETRRQRLHLQLRSGKTHNGKRVGAHGIAHHLRNGGDFGFVEGIPENRWGCRQDTHSQDTLCSQARTAQLMRLAQELHCHLCAPKQVLSSGVSHVSSMVVLSRAFLHEHFLFFTYLSHHTPRTLSTSRTSPSSLGRQVAP